MKNNPVPRTWEEALVLAVKKFDYEVAIAGFNKKNIIVRFFLMVSGKKPSNPCPGWPSETLASKYVQLFNEQYHIGKRREINSRDYVYVGLKYQVEDRLPVLNATYMEDGTGYVLRMKFNRNGGFEYRPCPYPESEFCFSVKRLPVRCGLQLLESADKMVPYLKDKLSKTLSSIQ